MTTLVVSFLGAVIISGLCSLAEAALYSIPYSQIELLEQQGKVTGRILKQMRGNMREPIAAILILNTVANTMGAAISGAAAVAVFGHRWLALFSAAFTFVILTFAEIIPKTIGVAFSRSIAPLMAMPLRVTIVILMPLIWFYNLVTGFIRHPHDDLGITAEEIQVVARLSSRSGQIDPDQEVAIRNILNLKKKRAWDIMTPRTVVFSLDANLTLQEANERAGIWPYSRVPVYESDPEDVVGVVLRRDMLLNLAKDRNLLKLRSIMKPVHFVPHSARLDRLLREFLELRQHLFIVIDEYGQIDGIVTLEDVIEEIVGKEIMDESDITADMQELARHRRQQVTASLHQRVAAPEPPADKKQT
jgi:CBS domain containing-hemolysin-like protein